ncbi:hypothetical protein L7F22_049670 [Adiantum nelumboides]|nr:hypothetical protein [Adiantum nelumboides]
MDQAAARRGTSNEHLSQGLWSKPGCITMDQRVGTYIKNNVEAFVYLIMSLTRKHTDQAAARRGAPHKTQLVVGVESRMHHNNGTQSRTYNIQGGGNGEASGGRKGKIYRAIRGLGINHRMGRCNSPH